MITRRHLFAYLPGAVVALSSSAEAAVPQKKPTQELAEAAQMLVDAFRAANVGQIVSMHDENAFAVYGPGPNPTHADLRKTWDDYFAPKVATDGTPYKPYHPIEMDHVEAVGELGYTRGRYWHGQEGAGPERYRAGGYFTGVWKRGTEGWRIVAFGSTATQKMPPLDASVTSERRPG